MTPNPHNKQRLVTVFIPTFNGASYVKEALDSINNQKMPARYSLEVIVIDSGSTDNTVDIIRNYPNVKLIEIPNSEFSHGATRDKAAKIARGEFILFLTQDAAPSHDRWLINMIEPFFISNKVGCVFGKQIPRSNEAATIKREVSTVFNSIVTDDSIVIHRHQSLVDGLATNPVNTFFSDANSAVRRSLLIKDVPFRKVSYSEDQLLAKDMQDKGYLVAYAPLGSVIHSNMYTAREYLKRKYDETKGIEKSLDIRLSIGKKEIVFGTIKSTVADWLFIIKDRDYSFASKLRNFFLSPAYNLNMRIGILLATKYRENRRIRALFSLEDKQRQK